MYISFGTCNLGAGGAGEFSRFGRRCRTLRRGERIRPLRRKWPPVQGPWKDGLKCWPGMALATS